MVYNLNISSIPDLNKKLKSLLLIVSLIILMITLTISAIAFNSYENKSKALAVNILKNKLSKFSSNYEYQIISITAQPIFRNLLNADHYMINNINMNDPFFYSLKRQIASFTAKYKNNTIFEGSKIFNKNNQVIFSQGDVSSPYYIAVNLCYRDSTTSFEKGAPCLGSWTFFINKEKLIQNLKNEVSDLTSFSISTPDIHNIFIFDTLKIYDQKLPNIDFNIKINDKTFKLYIISIIAIIFIAMLSLIIYTVGLFKRNYISHLFKIHEHLKDNTQIDTNQYKNIPKELKDLIFAVNKALKNRKLEAIENLAHDLKPPLKRLQDIANKVLNPTKQDILNVYTQVYLGINKLHNDTLENIDVKKVIYDCVYSIYAEQIKSHTLKIDCEDQLFFAQASYSHLLRVISNIIDNSIKATTSKINPVIAIKLFKEKNFINILISDNGIGLNEKYMNDVFLDDVSFSGSTGKGLAFCKKVINSFNGTITFDSIPHKQTQVLIQLYCSKAPFDYINSIFINQNTRFVIIDDEFYFYSQIKKIIPKNHKEIYISDAQTLNNFFQSDILKDNIYFIDYHFSENLTGIDIIRKFNLYGQAYLFSSSADFVKETFKELRKDIPILSKNYIYELDFIYANNYDCILVDDDTDVLSDAEMMAHMKNKTILCLNNFLQLKMMLNFLNQIIPITLDNNIEGDETKGLEIAENLLSKGFKNIAFQTGESSAKFNKFSYKVLCKGEVLYE